MGKLTRWAWAPFAAFAFWKIAVFGIVAYDPVTVRVSPRVTIVQSRALPQVRYVAQKRRRDYYLILAAVFVALLLRHYTTVWPVV